MLSFKQFKKLIVKQHALFEVVLYNEKLHRSFCCCNSLKEEKRVLAEEKWSLCCKKSGRKPKQYFQAFLICRET